MNILLKSSLLLGLALTTPVLTMSASSNVSAQSVTEAEAFAEAKRLRTVEGWKSFLKKYPKGTKAEFAAAYLARLQPKATENVASNSGGSASTKVTWSIITRNELGVNSALELSGAVICFVSGSPAQQAVSEYFRKNNMVFEKLSSGSSGAASQSYDNGQCDGLFLERSKSQATLNNLKAPGKNRILPEVIKCQSCG